MAITTTPNIMQKPYIPIDVLNCKFKELENNFKAEIRAAKIEIGYALLVSDKEKKRIQRLTEKTKEKIGGDALKKANGDIKKAISLICASAHDI